MESDGTKRITASRFLGIRPPILHTSYSAVPDVVDVSARQGSLSPSSGLPLLGLGIRELVFEVQSCFFFSVLQVSRTPELPENSLA
jgi:hypothetical protein